VNGNNQETTSLKEKILLDKKYKKLNNLKFIFAILLSNLFIYILMSSPGPQSEKKLTDIIRAGYQRVVIKGNSLIPKDQTALDISIINQNKKIIISQAKLIKVIDSTIDQSQFEIEINNDDSLKLAKENDLTIIPQLKSIPIENTSKRLGGNQHEIIF